MRSRGRCSGSGRRAGRRRSNDGTVIFSPAVAAAICVAASGLRSILFQISELKLELIEQIATLRGLAEPLVPQLSDCVFELLDQQRAMLRLALRRRSSRLCCAQRLALRDDQRMRTRKIVRKRIINA